jgi:hypothetical protein
MRYLNFLSIFIFVNVAHAVMPSVGFRYEGRLQGPTVTTGVMTNQTFTVHLKRPDGCGTNLGLSSWTSSTVSLDDGAFSINPGFEADYFAKAMDPWNAFGVGCTVPEFKRQLVIDWSGESFVIDLEDAPRSNLANYAIYANNASAIGNVAVQPSLSCSSNMVLKYNSGNTRFECSGLTSADIPGLSAAQIPAFAGDVTGTINATSVDKIRGVNIVATAPGSGQVLKYDGTNWAPAADDTVGTLPDATYATKGIVAINTDASTSGLFLSAGVLALPNVITAGTTDNTGTFIPVLTYDQKGRITNSTTAAINDSSKLPLAGGTLTGPLDMGGQNIINVTKVGIGTTPTTALDLTGTLTSRGTSTGGTPVAGQGKIYFDSSSNKFRVSENGSAYVDLVGGGGGGGTVTSITTGTGLTGGPITTSGTIAVDVGTTTGKIVQVQAANKLPAIDGSSLTNLDANNITSGILPVTNGGTNSGMALNNNRLMTSFGGAIVEGPAMADGQIVVGKTGFPPQVVPMNGDVSIFNTGLTRVDQINGTVVSGVGLLNNNVLQNISGSPIAANNVLVSNGIGTGVIGLSSPANGVFISSGSVPQWSATLPTTMGGTGLTSFAAGDLLYASSPTTISNLPIGGVNTVLSSNGTTISWSTPAGNTTPSLSEAGNTVSTTGNFNVPASTGSTGEYRINNMGVLHSRGGANNIFVGNNTGGYPTSVIGNAALGASSMQNLSNGNYNTAVGFQSLNTNTSGSNNTAIGAAALYSTTGNANTAVGSNALTSNVAGVDNTALGADSLFNNISGTRNTAVGKTSLNANVTSADNTAMGFESLKFNVSGQNTAIGSRTLLNNSGGTGNTAIGYNALNGNMSGSQNIGIGNSAGSALPSTSNYNVVIGSSTGSTLTGNGNILIADGGGTERIRIVSSGGNGYMGIGTMATSTPLAPLHVGQTLSTSTGSFSTQIIDATDSHASGSVSFNGLSVKNDKTGSGTTTAQRGISSTVLVNGLNSSNPIGIESFVSVVAATPTPIGIKSSIDVTGTTTTPVGLDVSITGTAQPSSASIGIKIGNIYPGIGGAFGLYQLDNSAKNYFAGNVGIGTTSPAASLDVNGTVKIGAAGTPIGNVVACTNVSFNSGTSIASGSAGIFSGSCPGLVSGMHVSCSLVSDSGAAVAYSSMTSQSSGIFRIKVLNMSGGSISFSALTATFNCIGTM